jgi:hypothetical protein
LKFFVIGPAELPGLGLAAGVLGLRRRLPRLLWRMFTDTTPALVACPLGENPGKFGGFAYFSAVFALLGPIAIRVGCLDATGASRYVLKTDA